LNVSDRDDLLNKAQRKKKRRKQRKQQERAAHRNLDDVTSVAIAEALRLAPVVVESQRIKASEQVIDVSLASNSEARFVQKRVNDALQVAEWLDEVSVIVWTASETNTPDDSATVDDSHAVDTVELRLIKRVEQSS